MPTIEKLAENFVKAASELIEATGCYQILMSTSPTIEMQVSEKQFDTLFGVDGIEIVDRRCKDYPIEKSIMVAGVKFFCLTKDWDTWAKLKGYVKKEDV
jgi:hypothetical protein